ncbi:helix-turn-helix domain-containing protein [Streptomyces sp. N2-109]|uniref:Helix-turn-helix domain-containing protein n=1 Tax=Streptomyces gossypii TaxID=2883101 RepID=A0ABT2JYN1_9ACTN|nr:helix-turn-helix domain-containing protein [Streptomyces gossypii]MCT2593010.1 helix-turn-helix domain-containing protein [Streptomyces gossypii]MCT2593743.1 helix-turn-helix domain-containing protein [Streptomyces gossypii]
MSAGSVALAVVNDSALPHWDVFELGIACAVFGLDHSDLADPWYELRLCGLNPGAPHAAPGFVLNAEYGLNELARADTVMVPAVPEECVDGSRELPEELLRALRRAADAGCRMVSLCNGSFALAAAGILDGRRATAHWAHTETLARRFPKVEVDDTVLYIDDGDVLTSAGLSGGLDLCLHLVRRDLGARVANQLARLLVVPAHRPGGQAQFVERAVVPADDDSLAPVLHWASSQLDRPLTVDELATRAGLSVRTFHRRLRAATGITPMQWLLGQRLSRAQELLESGDLPIEKVSELSGLGTANNLRRHFARHLGVSPTDYRRAFPAGGGGGEGGANTGRAGRTSPAARGLLTPPGSS